MIVVKCNDKQLSESSGVAQYAPIDCRLSPKEHN